MADALLGVVTEAVLTKVISLANEQIITVWGVEDDLQSLAKQLELIQALLSDAESKPTSTTVQLWLKDLEDAATDADDLLDEFHYEVQNKKTLKRKRDMVSSFFSSSNPLLFRFKMASEIKKINSQMDKIFENAKVIGLRPAEIRNSPTDPREIPLTDPFVDDSEIVGRGDDLSEIVSHLTCSEDEKNLSVIGIVGMGGQGKTTLAQLLMKNDEVLNHFEKTVWTCVSDDFNVDKVLKDMLQSLTGKASKLTNREAIVKRLSMELQGKRFLLVLDDIWNEDSQLWDCMNNSLQAIGGLEGSKIIVTTRNEVVVTSMKGFIHRLGVLSRNDSRELFEKMAFGNGRAAKNPQLVEIGQKIVARCGGVPLALKAIGGLLSSQKDDREWLKIEDNSIWSPLDAVRSAIKLSFNHLPSLSLKQCFAYCSVFPKDSFIRKNHTIQQWMAHGLLIPSSGSDLEMEDIGNNYFKILLQRSLLQEAKFDLCGNIISCKMHDLVHDFALETSKGHCLTAKVGELNDDIKVVHLSIVCDGSDNLNILGNFFSRLRTLQLPKGFCSKNCLRIICKCERLRVLTLADWRMKELPISIAKMKHLRYLDIFATGICALPEFISNLYNLQTLRLPVVPNLPKDFVRLVKLRHLYIKDDFKDATCLPGIGQLTSLRTLNYFRVSRDKGCQIEELCSLNDLEGTIRIVCLENVVNGDDARSANLSGKRNIESLKLVWSLPNSTERSSNNESVLEGLQPHRSLKALEIVNCMGSSLPSWMPQLHNITSLKLQNLAYCAQIPPLGHLQFLKELSFTLMSSLEEWSDMVQPSVELFPSLERLDISGCPCLTRLQEGLLSSSTGLESLSIRSCYKLVSIPDLSSLHCLKALSISDCQELSGLPRGIEACRSLQKLVITCPASVMKSLPHYFTNLRKLTLELSDNIMDHHVPTGSVSNTTADDIQGHDGPFSTLKYLHLFGTPQLKSLPEQIQRFTALRDLSLEYFNGLETLPKWLGNFHSLERLTLWRSDLLANFPSVEVMQGLTNLKTLRIINCPILKQRCERENGAEWHKIAHIPKRLIT